MSNAKASSQEFTDQEEAFFDEGETLADSPPAFEDFSDLDTVQDSARTSGPSWAERAMAVLAMVGPARTQS